MVHSVLQDIENIILADAEYDFTGFWEVFAVTGRELGTAQPELVTTLALAVIFDLLYSGAMVAGLLSAKGDSFIPWDQTPEQTIVTITEGMRKLGRIPTIGDIGWLDLNGERSTTH